MNSFPVASACPARETASASVAAQGFSPSTGYPACRASAVTAWWAAGIVTSMTASAPERRNVEGIGPGDDRCPLLLGHHLGDRAFRGALEHVGHADQPGGVAAQHGADPGPSHATGSDHDDRDEGRCCCGGGVRHAHSPFPAAAASPTPWPTAPVENHSVSYRSRKGTSRSATAGRAHRTLLAMTRRTSLCW